MLLQSKCSECGAPLPEDVLAGNCPACLLRLGAQERADPERRQGRIGSAGLMGRYFGDYEILGEIARGGMGVIFRARQVSLNRPVALKMILEGELASEAQLRRFQLEAEAAAGLEHPNIVPIYEIGVHEGRHYYSMKLIDGENLAAWSKRSKADGEAAAILSSKDAGDPADAKLPKASRSMLRERARMVLTVARAVHHAHQHGILHRDLKPTNILLAKDGTPFVSDFGIAKILNDKVPGVETVAAIGSPSYMAPEQVAGGMDRVTTATDVYGLGAILYDLLTGRPPFLGETPYEVIQQTVTLEPIPPRQLNTEVALDLEIICLKCLHKNPAERYGSALALSEDLQRWLAHEPILARRVTAGEQCLRWVRRNPKTAALYSALVLLLVTLAVGSTVAALRIKRAEQHATENLFDSYLAQAHAERRTDNDGRRARSMAAIRKAAAIQSTPDLRNETIATLAITDLCFTNRWSRYDSHFDANHECCDPSLQLRAFDRGAGVIAIHQVSDDREIAVFPGFGAPIEWLYGFSPGSRYLAARYSDHRTAIWDVQTRSCVLERLPDAESLDFARDDSMLMASCQDGQVRTFRFQAAKESASLDLNAVFHILRIEPGTDRFAACRDNDSEVQIRRTSDGQLLQTFSHPAAVGSVTWSDDGNLLGVGLESGRIVVWSMVTSNKLYELQGHHDTVVSLGFSHSGWLLGSSSWDDRFLLWDLAEGTRAVSTLGHGYQTGFNSDDRQIGTIFRGGEAGLLQVIPSPVLSRLNCFPAPRRGAWSLDVSPDGSRVASASADGIRIWRARDHKNVLFLPLEGCRSVLFSRDAGSLLTCGPGGIYRWPIVSAGANTSGEFELGEPSVVRTGITFNFAALSADGRWIAAANHGAGSLAFYDLQNPTNKFALVEQPRIQSPALSPNGRWAAAGNWKGSGVKVWDISNRREVCVLPIPSTGWGVFSPDSRKLVTSGTRYELWDTDTWKLSRHLSPADSNSRPGPIAFSPNGRLLAISPEPNIAELIDPESGLQLAKLEAPQSASLSSFCFSPDSSKLYALEWNKQVQVWDLDKLRAELKSLKLDW